MTPYKKMASSWILRSLRGVTDNLGAWSDGRFLSEDATSAMVILLEQVYRELILAENLDGLTDNELEALDLIRRALHGANTVHGILLEGSEVQQPQVLYSGSVGRPRFNSN